MRLALFGWLVFGRTASTTTEPMQPTHRTCHKPTNHNHIHAAATLGL